MNISSNIYDILDESNSLKKCFQTPFIKYNFNVIPVEGDGNCFYYCLEEAAKLGLLGEENEKKTHKDFRHEAYTIINANRDKYIQFFEGSNRDEQNANINKISTDGNWADEAEILVLANKYDRQFIIIKMDGSETKIGDDEKLNKIYLYYCNYSENSTLNHYELLIPKLVPSKSVPSKSVPSKLVSSKLVPSKSVPIEPPKGALQEYNYIENQEDIEYFIYDLNIGDDEFYKIILKYPINNKNILQLKDLFTQILNRFLSSEIYVNKYRDNSQYYPELFTLLLGDYLKLIGDNSKLLSDYNNSLEKGKINIIDKYTNNLIIYVSNYLEYGLRLDNTKEINKRIFMNNLLDSIINPTNIKDNFSPNLNKNLPKLYKLKKIYFGEKNWILPDKRKTLWSGSNIEKDYKSGIITLEDYERIYNYILDEKININNDYTFIINWIFKTFCKSYLEFDAIGKDNKLTSIDFEKLNEYFDIQKNINVKTHNIDFSDLNKFLIQKQNKKYQQIFYNKWNDLLTYFSIFKKYYYDDEYYNDKNINKSQVLSHCLENFISNKAILNNDNDDPSNFRYLFTYCLMTKSSRDKLENIFPNISKENIINISNIKWYFFKYLKYLQDLNQFNINCKLVFETGTPIVNYCNYYLAKQMEFYGRLNLNFNEYPIYPDSEIFYNYIIYMVMSEPINYLCNNILKISHTNEIFINSVKLFISNQYNKI